MASFLLARFQLTELRGIALGKLMRLDGRPPASTSRETASPAPRQKPPRGRVPNSHRLLLRPGAIEPANPHPNGIQSFSPRLNQASDIAA
jgi:hypothetical protein